MTLNLGARLELCPRLFARPAGRRGHPPRLRRTRQGGRPWVGDL